MSCCRDHSLPSFLLPPFTRCKLVLVSGSTGSGKSLLLETLEQRGEQVLHLERLAK